MLVGIGGNGTCAGIKALSERIRVAREGDVAAPPPVQTFFVPVTIDSDIEGTECVGQHTAVEAGAEKVRCFVADARTHQRCYIVEMMGADGGFHALNSV